MKASKTSNSFLQIIGKPFSAIVLAAACIMLMVPAIVVFGDSGILNPGGGTTTGQEYAFTVNIPQDIFGESFSVSISISPAVQSMSAAGVSSSYNPVTGSIKVDSSALSGQSSFPVTAYLGELMQDTTYTVTASIALQSGGTRDDSFSFTAKAATQGGGNNPGGEDGDAPGGDDGNVPGGGGGNNSGDKDQPGGQKPGNQNGNGPGNQNGNSAPGSKIPSGTAGLGYASGGVSTVDTTLVYAGSDDNYLKALSVKGHKFTQKFNRTRSTYFIDVDDEVTSVDVTATANSSSATVEIAGDSDLSGEGSKILISVTSESGSVRTYRIYVRHR